MDAHGRTYLIREFSEREADQIMAELQRMERDGHQIADVRHTGTSWSVFAHERRFRDQTSLGIISFRRRASD
jgi:hypothetical protein